MNHFEGYVGIQMWEGQQINDILFAFILVLFILFALIYRMHSRLFSKMLKDVVFVRKRLSLFESPVRSRIGAEWIYRNFMLFQALLLCSLSLFGIGWNKGYIHYETGNDILIYIGLFFLIILLFYFFKQIIYYLFGSIFSTIESYKLWKISYNAIIGTWGILLYIPLIWMFFIDKFADGAILMFLFLYIFSRFVIIYKTIRIFHIKNTGFLYIITYLCAQEILPLFFLYKGTFYLYNIIEVNTLWH